MSSSSRSSNSTKNSTSTHDERVAADNGANVVRTGDNSTVEITDGGAIAMAGMVAEDALEAAEGFSAQALTLGLGSLDMARDTLDASNAAFESFADKTRTESAQFFDNLIMYGIPAVVVIFLLRSKLK